MSPFLKEFLFIGENTYSKTIDDGEVINYFGF